MALNSVHPLYAKHHEDWCLMRDVYRRERAVKEKRRTYLPATSGMIADGVDVKGRPGYEAYQAYLTRAVFHDFVAEAVEAMIGMMHHKPPAIELPAALEPLRELATLNGESLAQLLRRINEAQLVTGRIGLLLDLPAEASLAPRPYIATYKAEDILNWDDGRRDELTLQTLNLVVLNESEFERQREFEWELKEKYRVLMLGRPDENEPSASGAVYRVGTFRDANTTFSEAAMRTPSIRGRSLERIPFTFINSKDILPEPDGPPLLGLAKLALAIYRGEADYRQTLFMQGQDTLVIVGGNAEDELRVGANAKINLPIGGDAKYIGVGHQGLAEQRQALENDKRQAATKGAQMIDTMSREKESGEALKVRVSAKTATLNDVALAGAGGLQQLLRTAAEWMGADPMQVVVTPNLDFSDDEMVAKDLVDLVSAKMMGAPISNRSIHLLMHKKGLTEMEYEDELAEIEQEEPLVEPAGTGAGGDPEEDEGDTQGA